MINKERMELWIQALEQDRFTKCTGRLRDIDGAISEAGEVTYRHCALGVGVQVALENGLFSERAHEESFTDILFRTGNGFLPLAVSQWYGLNNSNPGVNLDGQRWGISVLNDGTIVEGITGMTFWDIAQLMRAMYLKDDVS